MNPIEQLDIANEAYHVAVDKILKLNANVSSKAHFASMADAVFSMMVQARSYIESLIQE